MRRAGDGRGFAGTFFQQEKPLRQPVELRSDLLDHTPLLGELVGEFIDRNGLMGDMLFQAGNALGVGLVRQIGHGCPRRFVRQARPIAGELSARNRAGQVLRKQQDYNRQAEKRPVGPKSP